MSKIKYLLFLLFIPISVYASCSSSELSRYKILASNISNYYDYNGSSFDITFYNVSSELRIVNKLNGSEYRASSNFGDIFIGNLPSGNINFAVYPINGECNDYRVYTFYVPLPYLNKYYNDPVCSNNSNILCSKWANTSMYSREQFINEVSKTKEEDVVITEPEKEYRKYGFFDFLGDYYIYILLFIIVSGSVGIYFLDKKSKFDFKVS